MTGDVAPGLRPRHLALVVLSLFALTACGGSGGGNPVPEDRGGSGPPLAAPDFAYATDALSLTRFQSVGPLMPTHTGGVPASWSVTPPLPAGVVLDAGTGMISGGAHHAQANRSYTITARNAAGADTETLELAVAYGGLALAWSLPGQSGAQWVMGNYVDLDPAVGTMLDYAGGIDADAKSYDNHLGIDVGVPSFRAMDNNFPILAGDDGTVIGLHDGEPDRNTSCVGLWNYVEILHPDGWRTVYGHLKRNSVAVSVGQKVQAGDTLGVVGSSGCSTAPHLHLEVINPSGESVSPFQEGLFRDPPAYDTPISLMESVVRSDIPDEFEDFLDPPPDTTSAAAGSSIALTVCLAGGRAGDVIRARVLDGLGNTFAETELIFDRVHRQSYWYWWCASRSPTGLWRFEIRLNGVLVGTHTLSVS